MTCSMCLARLRAIFDQWGAEGLTNGVRTSAGGDTTPWVFSQNPEDMFREFFGSTSPFAGYFGSESGLSLSLANKGAESGATLPPIEVHCFFICAIDGWSAPGARVMRTRLNPRCRHLCRWTSFAALRSSFSAAPRRSRLCGRESNQTAIQRLLKRP